MNTWIEITMAIIMLAAIIFAMINRGIFGGKRKGIGARIIQFMAVTLGVPAIVILSLEKILSGEIVGALFAGLFGYVLARVGEFKNKNRTTNSNSDTVTRP